MQTHTLYRGIIVFALTGLLAGIFPEVAAARDTLTVARAVQLGLENNYAIRIARNEADIAENNNSLGNAGFLPRLSVSGTQTGNLTNSRQEYAFNNQVNERTGATSQSLNSNVSLNWTLFDGFRMFTTRQSLQALEEQGETNARLTIESTVGDIINGYFNIVRQQQTLNVLRDALSISHTRLNIARQKESLGSGSGLETLQAQSDLNSDSSAYLRQRAVVQNAQIDLNRLLARDPETGFSVTDSIPIRDDLVLADLQRQVDQENSQLQRARINRHLANLSLQQIRSERMPVIDLNAGYGFSKSRSQSGFLKSNRSSGYNIGLTASLSLFDGFDVHRRAQNAKIRIRNNEENYQDIHNEISASLRQIYEDYRSNLQLLQLERENVEVARHTLEVAQERYRLGTIAQLELREAQRTYVQAVNRRVNVQYLCKVAETELQRLSGRLMQTRPAGG